MTPDRWQEVSRLYQSALAQPVEQRAAFLAGACRDDSDLRREVEGLLAQEQAGLLVDRPVGAAAAAVIGGAPGLAPGTVIGAYRVTGLLGAGGMGSSIGRRTPSCSGTWR